MNKKRLIYIGILFIITVIVSITYFSYAYLTRVDEQKGKINIVAGTLEYKITSSDLTNKSITLLPNESKQIEVKIKSLNEIASKYQLYIENIEDVSYGYLNDGDLPEGSIEASEIKTIKVALKNNSDTNKTITFGVQGGFSDNILILEENRLALGVYCSHSLCEWFALNNYDSYSIQDVLTDSTRLTALMNNSNAVNYLLSSTDTILAIKSSEYYDQYVVPVMLDYAKTSPAINTTMYNAKLPAYIYNYGTYYLINNFTYAAPANSCQTRSFSNTAENGLYFNLVGASSASQSIGTTYSDQTVNPNGYTKLNINYNFSKNLAAENSKISLCNGTISSVNWSATMSSCIAGVTLETGENTGYIDLSGLSVNSNYRVVLEQLVNLYQTAGNYYNTVYVRSMYVS